MCHEKEVSFVIKMGIVHLLSMDSAGRRANPVINRHWFSERFLYRSATDYYRLSYCSSTGFLNACPQTPKFR